MAITETLEREAASPGAEARAIEGLAVACPRLDPGSVQAMRAVHVVERLESLAIYNGLHEARRRVCADPDGWVRDVPAAPASLRPQIVFDRCGFAGLDVLDGSEQLLGDDVDVLFALATLERDGVDRALLRRLGRALMISGAPLPVAARRCAAMPGYDGCRRLLAVAGVEPAPTSGNYESLREEPRLLLSPTALLWDGEVLPADVAGHRNTAVAVAVAAAINEPGAHARERRFVLAPDRGLEFGVVVDALHTMSTGGALELALVGRGEFSLVAVPVVPPLPWLDLPVVTIDGSTVSVTLRPGETTRLAVDAGGALTELATRARAADSYGKGEVHVRATRATRVDTVIAVMGALRGPECPRDDDGDGCGLSRPVLDLEPPLE